MNEKQTPESNSLPEPEKHEIISQSDINMMNSWVEESKARSTTNSIPQEAHNALPATEKREHGPLKGTIAWSAVAAASIMAGAFGIAATSGGSDNPERGEADTTISSITLNSDAHVRQDPYVADEPNLAVLHLEEPITINAGHDIRVLEGTNDGTWYGISAEDIVTQYPNIQIVDKDGEVWVNEQGVQSISNNQTQKTEE